MQTFEDDAQIGMLIKLVANCAKNILAKTINLIKYQQLKFDAFESYKSIIATEQFFADATKMLVNEAQLDGGTVLVESPTFPGMVAQY